MKLMPDLRVVIAVVAVLFAGAAAEITAEESPKPDGEKKSPPAAAENEATAKKAEAKPSAKPKLAAKPAKKTETDPRDTKESGKQKKGEADDEKAEEKTPEKPAVHKVTRGEFELKVELEGVFESAQATPISVAPQAWNDLSVIEVVAHGTRVKKGDVLIRFDTEKLEEEIADLRENAPLEDLNLRIARQDLAALEKSTPLSLKNARRQKMEAEQDLAYFEDVTKELREKDAHEDIKRIEQQLSYAREELAQLEKMYQADDLTEETEEIILQRARNDVAYYEWIAEQTRSRSRRALTTSIPREHAAQRRGVENQSLAWRQAEAGLPATLEKKRLEVAGQERARKKAEERLAELESDLASMVVKAPHEGVVYYGASNRGKWVTAATIERKLTPGGKLGAHEVFLTLVKPAPLRIHVSVPEAKLRHLEPGQKGFAWPAFDADAEFPTQLKTVSFVPYADNTYDAAFTVPKQGAGAGPLYPGMTAKVRLDLYEAADALTAPKAAVHKDADGHYVHLKDGTKRKVKVGKANEKVYEILGGLREGDEIKNP